MAEKGTIKWEMIDDLMLACGTPGEPDPALWDELNRALDTSSAHKWLVLSLGTPALNSHQRTRSAEIVKRRKLRIAVVSDERITRGMATAASWLGADIKAFPWRDLKGALTFLNVGELLHDRISETAARLKQEVQRETDALNRRG